MRSPTLFKILLIILLILLAAPLLGGLGVMAIGGGIPAFFNGRMIGLAAIWILLIAVLLVCVVVPFTRRGKSTSQRGKVA
jgi:hypothetical protein